MQPVFLNLIFIICVWIMFQSASQLFILKKVTFPIFSWQYFIALIILYMICIIGFAILYFVLWVAGYAAVTVEVDPTQGSSLLYYLGNLVYFSTMTMLTVGYGDITPLGLAKALASIQALVGYLLPPAFFISGMIDLRAEKDRENAGKIVERLTKRTK